MSAADYPGTTLTLVSLKSPQCPALGLSNQQQTSERFVVAHLEETNKLFPVIDFLREEELCV